MKAIDSSVALMISTMDSTETAFVIMTNSTMNGIFTDAPGNGVNKQLILASQILSTSILINLMLSMGVTIDLNDVKETFRRPFGFFIGMASQFVLMPLIGFCMALAFRLESAGALSLLILCCCPGGTLSNLFAYWTDGDVCLSVSMTTISTGVAIGMMPLNLFIYTRVWTDEASVIPYVNIVTTLATILIPALFGLFMRWWKREWSKWITRVTLVLSVLLIIAAYTVTFLLNPEFYKAGWALWICAAVLPLVGFAIGYVFALLLRQSPDKCRTIAFETGCQNVAISSTLTTLTFANSPLFLDMLFYPALYSVFIVIDCFAVLGLYKFVVYLQNDSDVEKDEKDGPKFVKGAVNRKETVNSSKDISTYAVYSQNVETESENCS